MLRKHIPYSVYKRLFGDREKYGLTVNEKDNDWVAFHESSTLWDFYQSTQIMGMAGKVFNMQFAVINRIDFTNNHVLEVGPGIIRHLQYIVKKPIRYTICDINEEAILKSQQQLVDAEISCEALLLDRENDGKLPIADESYDLVISFNSLEHLDPLDSYLVEIKRILKKGGQLVGGIPCEGGLAWGLGRFLTTRRYVHKNYGINYDKIICWEHPNFADFIINRLDAHFERELLKLHPFPWLPLDFNLVASFVHKKP